MAVVNNGALVRQRRPDVDSVVSLCVSVGCPGDDCMNFEIQQSHMRILDVHDQETANLTGGFCSSGGYRGGKLR